MSSEQDLQRTVEIANDYSRQIPIGTLVYYGVPTSKYAFQGISVDRSSWTAVDAEFLHSVFGAQVHPSLQALIFLIRHRYFSARYRLFNKRINVSHSETLTLFKVRVYSIPSDVDGSRFVRSWRRSWSRNSSSLQKKAKDNWSIILAYLDFSPDGWASIECASKNTIVMCIPFFCTRKESQNVYHHMRRWASREPFSSERQKLETMESVVKSVYSQIKTPDLSHYSLQTPKASGVPSAAEAIAMLLRGEIGISGLSSELYPFQLRSVCKMYEKESISSRECVPHFVKFTSPTDTTYYYDTLGHGFYVMPELYTVPKGGILAENMGLGKTLICLALVCLTKHEISSIPDDLLVHEVPETRVFRNKLKTLAHLCLTTIAQNSLPWRYFMEDLPPTVVDKISQSPGVFHVPFEQNLNNLGLRGRASKNSQSAWRKLFLTSATLVVVPENLLHQWNDEAKKHVDAGFLKRLFISERFKTRISHKNAHYSSTVPQDPASLMAYDLIVVSVPSFSKLGADSNVFMSIYWKRLIIDEGHSMSSRSSNLTSICKMMHAERRWVVTGTPTSGLTNLHMDEDSAETTLESPRKKRKYVIKGKFNSREDLGKLGILIANYFKIEPFHSQPALWGSSVVKNLANGNQLTTKISLQNLLDSLMVRHNQSQVEADLVLPQLHHEVVFLEPSYQNKLAMNLFNAVLAVNAVSSERVGGDYMFDPSNRQQLQRLVSNLQLSTFYWTGFQVSDVNSLLEIAQNCIYKKDPIGQSYYAAGDVRLLEKSLSAIKRALRNPRWRAAATLHEMQIYVSGLPSPYIRNYATGSIANIGVYGAPQLNAVQKFFYKNRFLSMNDHEELSTRLQESSKSFWTEYWLRSEKSEKGRFSKQETTSSFDPRTLKEEGPNHRNSLPKKPSSTQGDGIDDFHVTSHYDFQNSSAEEDAANLAQKNARILGTASAKLSYLASKLVGHHKEGVKSIVFFEYEDSAYYLTELLDILGVSYILYATFIGAEQRPNNLHAFASHDSTKSGVTLIMDLKLASHGLTVISATRVYFINPVWHRSVEAQAIKRAHRIGQTKEVFVETLVLRGTLEEEIYRRRVQDESSEDRESSTESQRYVIDDTGMQNFVLRHEFLAIDETESEYADFTEDVGHHFGNNSGEADSGESPEPEFSLPSHSSEIMSSNGKMKRAWSMRLFSEANLQRINESRQERPTLERLNAEFVEGKEHHSYPDRARASTRKRVRF